jgi:hypothetical protein
VAKGLMVLLRLLEVIAQGNYLIHLLFHLVSGFNEIFLNGIGGSNQEPSQRSWRRLKPDFEAAFAHRILGKGLHFGPPRAEQVLVRRLVRRELKGYSPDHAATDREESRLPVDSALRVVGYGCRGRVFR